MLKGVIIGAYRFHFYSNERNEPAHIHIRFNDTECKFWLDPIRLAGNRGIPAHKLHEIEKLVFENHDFLLEKYNEYHKNKK